ncbi:MAG: hypothetical protein ACP5U0_09890 [Caldisphaera sp.]
MVFISSPFNWEEDFTGLYPSPIFGMVENSILPSLAISLPSIYNKIMNIINGGLFKLEEEKNPLSQENVESSFKVLVYSVIATYLTSIYNYFSTGAVGSGTSIIGVCLFAYFCFLFSYRTKINCTNIRGLIPSKRYAIITIRVAFVFACFYIAVIFYGIGLLFTPYYRSVFYHLEGLFFFTLIFIAVYGFRKFSHSNGKNING